MKGRSDRSKGYNTWDTIDGAIRNHWKGMITAKDPIRSGLEPMEYAVEGKGINGIFS